SGGRTVQGTVGSCRPPSRKLAHGISRLLAAAEIQPPAAAELHTAPRTICAQAHASVWAAAAPYAAPQTRLGAPSAGGGSHPARSPLACPGRRPLAVMGARS